jgi:hypothetical protein
MGVAYQYAVHDGHLEIHDNDLVAGAALLEGASLDQLYCLFAICGLIAVDAILAHEDLLEDIPVHVNVVHDQDLRAFTNRCEIHKRLILLACMQPPGIVVEKFGRRFFRICTSFLLKLKFLRV